MATGTTSCPFCGRPLPRQNVGLPGRRPMIVTMPCQCAGARAEAEREERERASARRARDFADRWRRAGIPEEFAHVEASYAHVAGLDGGGALYLTGPVGRGKTHLACQTAKAWLIRHLAERPSLLFLAANGIGSQISASWHRWDRTEEDVFAVWCGVGLLVLDDLGKGTGSEMAAEAVFRVVDERMRHRRATVITSQYTTRELADRYDRATPGMRDALLSRLRGTRCEGVVLDGPDRRLAHAG